MARTHAWGRFANVRSELVAGDCESTNGQCSALQPDLRLLAAEERHDGHRGAVLLVVVVEREVPPAAVLLLERQEDVGQMVLEVRSLGGGQLVDAQGGVPVAVVVEIAGDVEERFVRDRAVCGPC